MPGRGIGCVALQDVKRGGLIFTEFPQLSLSDEMLEDLDNFEVNVVKSFLAMSSEVKERYMKLHNNYKIEKMEDCDNWSYEMKEEYKGALPKLALANFSEISMAGAFDVWGIYKTNTFTDGVYLQMSRVNHSCRPNAEISDSDSNTADLRALRKIKEGDEITICYIDDDKSRWTREERSGDLKSVYNFDCACEGCDMTEEEIQEEAENVSAFKEQLGKEIRLRDLKVKIMSFD